MNENTFPRYVVYLERKDMTQEDVIEDAGMDYRTYGTAAWVFYTQQELMDWLSNTGEIEELIEYNEVVMVAQFDNPTVARKTWTLDG